MRYPLVLRINPCQSDELGFIADLAIFGYLGFMDINAKIDEALKKRGISAAKASRMAVGNPSAIRW